LPRPRIVEIVERSLNYMRHLVGQSEFTPLSFRAGNWLFQPTRNAASVLAENGIKIDSSVFKGGVQRNYGLDYRPARKNGYYWPFSSDANLPDPSGPWIEIPIYSEMVPVWKMATSKRISFGNTFGMAGQSSRGRWNRMHDFLRFRYPKKLDFCRMTLDELTSMMGRVIREDRNDPSVYRPVVAIGHSKDFTDPKTLNSFLGFLQKNRVRVSTFEVIYSKLLPAPRATAEVACQA